MTQEQLPTAKKLFTNLLGTLIDTDYEQLPKEEVIKVALGAVNAYKNL